MLTATVPYHSAYRGNVLSRDGKFDHFLRNPDESHLRRGYWRFQTISDDRRTYALGFVSPEHLLLEQDQSENTFDEIILRWVPGTDDMALKSPLSGTAAQHLRIIYELRALLGLPMSLRGHIPIYPMSQDPKLKLYYERKEAAERSAPSPVATSHHPDRGNFGQHLNVPKGCSNEEQHWYNSLPPLRGNIDETIRNTRDEDPRAVDRDNLEQASLSTSEVRLRTPLPEPEMQSSAITTYNNVLRDSDRPQNKSLSKVFFHSPGGTVAPQNQIALSTSPNNKAQNLLTLSIHPPYVSPSNPSLTESRSLFLRSNEIADARDTTTTDGLSLARLSSTPARDSLPAQVREEAARLSTRGPHQPPLINSESNYRVQQPTSLASLPYSPQQESIAEARKDFIDDAPPSVSASDPGASSDVFSKLYDEDGAVAAVFDDDVQMADSEQVERVRNSHETSKSTVKGEASSESLRVLPTLPCMDCGTDGETHAWDCHIGSKFSFHTPLITRHSDTIYRPPANAASHHS